MSPPSRHHASASTMLAVERSAGELSTLAVRRMEENLDWYRRLSAEERSQVGLVAQAGISQFIAWFRQDDQSPSAISIFANAPQELTRTVSLRHTLDLVRTVVDVVESRVESLAGPGDEQLLRESVLRFSREIAFAAAEVYAGAAEARGAWDARLEALVVDAVLRGEADDSMQSRASALGWGEVSHVTFVVGSTRRSPAARCLPSTSCGGRCASTGSRRWRSSSARVSSRSSAAPARRSASSPRWPTRFGPGPDRRRPHGAAPLRRRTLGPRRPERALGRSRRGPTPRASSSPRPCCPSERSPGDQPARRILVDRVHRPLAAAAQAPLLQTATAYLESGGSLEATARALFVHANTVRYRLGRISDLTGYDLATPREAWVVRIALALGRLSGEAAPAPLATPPGDRARSTLGSKVQPYAVRRVASPTSSRAVVWRNPPKDRV